MVTTMHILLITNYFAPDSGAAATRLTRLARLLQQRNHQVTVLTSLPHYPQNRIHDGYRRQLVVVENRAGIRVIQTWLWTTPSPRISRKLSSQISFMLTASLRGIAIKKPDVILIEAQPIFTSLVGVWLALLKRRPYILNVSDLWPDHLLSVGALTENSRVYRLARRVVDFTYRRARHIVAMSPGWAEQIQQHIGPSKKLEVIYNGVDLERFRPDVDTETFRQKYQLGNAQLVTFIGTFATQYDFGTMLNVAGQLQSRDDVRFVFIGNGSQGDYFKNALTQQPLPNIHWLDWIDHEEIPAAWAASYLTFWAMGEHDLYRGTIPAKLYEALACGVPVVAAMDGHGATMIENSGGITVPCRDVAGLTDAIQRILDDGVLRATYSQAARQYAESHFDPLHVALQYETVLQAACQFNN